MSIKEWGQTKVSIERRTFKINCWEKMQTKCFCYGERGRIRTDCSNIARPWIWVEHSNFTDAAAEDQAVFFFKQESVSKVYTTVLWSDPADQRCISTLTHRLNHSQCSWQRPVPKPLAVAGGWRAFTAILLDRDEFVTRDLDVVVWLVLNQLSCSCWGSVGSGSSPFRRLAVQSPCMVASKHSTQNRVWMLTCNVKALRVVGSPEKCCMSEVHTI